MEPPVSVPSAAIARFAATATAEPPEEPPGTYSMFAGFFTGPNAEFSLELPMANSSMFVFPNNDARLAAIQRGDFGWVSTATLVNTGIVERSSQGTNGYYYNPAAFDTDGELKSDFVTIQDPSNANCAQCHGIVHSDKSPLTLTGCSLDNPQTSTTGQVISSQKISESGMNLADKSTLNRAWDIHTERGQIGRA